MIPQRPSTTAKTPTFSSGRSLNTTFDDTSARGCDVPAEEAGIADLHQRVVDLEVEDVLDAAGLELGRAGRDSARAVSVPPWPFGLRNSRPGSSSSSRPVARSQRRHRSLLEERSRRSAGRPKKRLSAEERLGVGVRRRAGHHQERDRLAVPPRQGQHLLGVDLEQRSRRTPGRPGTSPSACRSRAGCPGRRRRAAPRPRRGAAPPRRSARSARDGVGRLDRAAARSRSRGGSDCVRLVFAGRARRVPRGRSPRAARRTRARSAADERVPAGEDVRPARGRWRRCSEVGRERRSSSRSGHQNRKLKPVVGQRDARRQASRQRRRSPSCAHMCVRYACSRLHARDHLQRLFQAEVRRVRLARPQRVEHEARRALPAAASSRSGIALTSVQ